MLCFITMGTQNVIDLIVIPCDVVLLVFDVKNSWLHGNPHATLLAKELLDGGNFIKLFNASSIIRCP